MNLENEGFTLGLTMPLSRRDVLESHGFSDMRGMPQFLAGALRSLARDRSIGGLAVVDYKDGVTASIIRDRTGIGDADRQARIGEDFAYLELKMADMHPDYVNMGEKPFDVVEAEIRQKVASQPEAQLLGIFRFID